MDKNRFQGGAAGPGHGETDAGPGVVQAGSGEVVGEVAGRTGFQRGGARASIGSTGGTRTMSGSLRRVGRPGQESGCASVWSVHPVPEQPAGKGGKRWPFTSVLQ